MSHSDTIFALSSGAVPSGVAVIRLSGPGVRAALTELCGDIPSPRKATLREFQGAFGAIDRGLALYFPGPSSFTGEDCAEFHVHGGRAVVAAMLEELGRRPHFRMAEAGEFTRRAFVNGKLDLTQAEALADLVAAETEAQRRLAMMNAEGGQRRLYEEWRSRLLHARAMIEAELDFSDEGDVPGFVSEAVWNDVAELAREMRAHAAAYRRAEIVREGFRVVIVGSPNSGKSTLLNALARRDAAIVTEEPGTTRDLIEMALDIDGMKVVLVDTAGIRDHGTKVEMLGIARTMDAARQADMVLYLEDMNTPARVDVADSATIRVGTKADLVKTPSKNEHHLVISAHTGQGLDELLKVVGRHASDAAGASGTGISPVRERQRMLVEIAATALDEAACDDRPLELRAEELRRSGEALGRIVGTVGTEELLGAIFSEFCIGK